MSAIYLAILFGAIAVAYFLTTGDPYGTLGVIAWYLFYAGSVSLTEYLPVLVKKFTNE